MLEWAIVLSCESLEWFDKNFASEEKPCAEQCKCKQSAGDNEQDVYYRVFLHVFSHRCTQPKPYSPCTRRFTGAVQDAVNGNEGNAFPSFSNSVAVPWMFR